MSGVHKKYFPVCFWEWRLASFANSCLGLMVGTTGFYTTFLVRECRILLVNYCIYLNEILSTFFTHNNFVSHIASFISTLLEGSKYAPTTFLKGVKGTLHDQ